jgi:hypothetical protein
MTFTKPAHIGNQVFDDIEQFINAEAAPSEFELARIKRDVAKLRRADHAQAFMAESALAALTWDERSATACVQKALRLDRSAIMLSNASLTLRSVCLMCESCEFALEAMRAEPADMMLLSDALDALALVGRWDEGAELLSDALNKGMKPARLHAKFDSLMALLGEAGISLARLKFELSCAAQVLRQAKVRYRGTDLSLAEDPESGQLALVHQTICYGTIEDELRLESALGQLLANEPGWNPEKLAVEIACQREDAHQPA